MKQLLIRRCYVVRLSYKNSIGAGANSTPLGNRSVVSLTAFRRKLGSKSPAKSPTAEV